MLKHFFPNQTCIVEHDSVKTAITGYRGDYITKRLKLGRFYEIEMLTHLQRVIPQGSTIIDAGAFIGNHSLFFAKHCQATCVHSFEPFPSTFQLLDHNVKSNDLQAVVLCHNKALGDEDTTARMASEYRDNQGSNRITDDGDTEVFISSLDGTFQQNAHDLSNLSLIKIDTEGCAEKVIKGAWEIISKHKPMLAVEVMPEPVDTFIELLKPLGYELTHTFNATPTHIFEA